MGRARGSNASVLVAFEATTGTPPASGFYKTPVASIALGEEQGLIEDDLIGLGRDPQMPGRDVINNRGDAVVPLCARNIGLWLKSLFGAPTTVQGLAATGSYTFSAQPANNATITVGGQAFTFVSGAPAANQIKIGADLAETVANAVRALNQSAVAGVAAATYYQNLGLDPAGNVIRIVHDTIGTAGNSFTTVAGSSPASNATPSGATLAGGAATGAYNHTFVTGGSSLPTESIEVGLPEVPEFGMNYGVAANTLAVPIQRSGMVNATIGLMAQGEAIATATQGGTPTELSVQRFSAFSGSISRLGVPIADLTGGAFNFGNGLDPVEVIRGDGRVGGFDSGKTTVGGQMDIRYGSRDLQSLAENGTAIDLEHRWYVPGTVFALRVLVHEVYLPKPKRPITNAGAILAGYAWQGAKSATVGRAATIVLTNDVPNYN